MTLDPCSHFQKAESASKGGWEVEISNPQRHLLFWLVIALVVLREVSWGQATSAHFVDVHPVDKDSKTQHLLGVHPVSLHSGPPGSLEHPQPHSSLEGSSKLCEAL